ncbi:putative disease resistance protein RGA3 [Citrus clementina]|uniref:putative disease resistance protein RGA3 n=1 Tax=Citrus clementina TaxID=85681 RepID=UPI000CED648C|nr:putative disease resistance protein RGA3 [Citrus x clementina]
MSEITETTARLHENSGGKSYKVRQRLPRTYLSFKEGFKVAREELVTGWLRLLDLEGKFWICYACPTDIYTSWFWCNLVGSRDAGGGQDNSCSACLLRRSTNVQDHFDLQAWPCVAEDFDILKVMKSVLESIATDQPVDDNDLNLLQGKLKKQFSGKKFLLVLDDPWNDNYNHWRTSAVHLNLVHWAGSKVVITTRSMNVATMMATTSIYPLEYLSDEDYLCILAEKSLGTIDFSNHSTMIRNPVSERSSQHIDIREDNNIEDHKAYERRNWTRSKSE